jgi:diaminohydroxyphosphoribosylaminopyrimidine deaminase / 5-amino-6-(5-phosphoribosylamino)uracil reductase
LFTNFFCLGHKYKTIRSKNTEKDNAAGLKILSYFCPVKAHEHFMKRCTELAIKGAGSVSPNPQVGCVIVCDNEIIGEGYHERFGGPHAEVNAIASVTDSKMLSRSVLYVNLEPCSHHGKTPPCTSLIIRSGIPAVICGTADPFPEVSGRGILQLREAGLQVTEGVLHDECRFLNRRFFCFHENKRPWIILKWAQTTDGYIDYRGPEQDGPPGWITSDASRTTVHRWRAEEDAIMVGTRTAAADNPQLTTRAWRGKNPLRIVIDRKLRLPRGLHLFDGSTPTLCFTASDACPEMNGVEFVKVRFDEGLPNAIMSQLYRRNIQSVIIEGGKMLLDSFINEGLWDEARVFTGSKLYGTGTPAPEFPFKPSQTSTHDGDILCVYYRQNKF